MMKFFTSDLRRNLTKILCLTVGLAIGFLLVAKVWFEQTYDAFFPNADRIYVVKETFERNGEFAEYGFTPGAIAPGMKRYIPQVEDGTRIRQMVSETKIKLADGRSFDVDGGWLADERLFDVLPTRIIAGDPHDVMEVERQVMIPQSLAEKIGGDVIGLEFTVQSFSDSFKLTIGGVYEDYPLNSMIDNVVYVSLPTIALVSYDGRDNWMGNDGYRSFIRLASGVVPDDIKPGVRAMLEDNVDKEALDMFHFTLRPVPLVGFYSSQESVRSMSLMLTFLAVVLLMSAALNYLLVTIGQMGRRAKEMAVRKCYGTSSARIFGRIMGESLFFLLVSALLAVLLTFCFPDLCRRLLGYTPAQLFSIGNLWLVEGAVMVVLLAITGAVPAWLYCRTPVASAFRGVARGRRGWKLALLSLEFFASGLLLCLLVIVGRQYYMMAALDMGFEYKNLAHVDLSGVPQDKREALVSELRNLGCVESVASAWSHPTAPASGNNVWLGDDYSEQVNVADMYGTHPEFFATAGIKFLQGGTFRELADSTVNLVVVEERFIDVLEKLSGVKDRNIVGRRFKISEHTATGSEEFEVCGVVANQRRHHFENGGFDDRSAVWFPSRRIDSNVYVRFSSLTPETMNQAQEVLSRVIPDKELYVTPMSVDVEAMTEPVRRFATSVLIAGLAILLIAMTGLVGYTADEAQRRAREIAIRKVNGESAADILKLFCGSILKVALPSLVAGGAVAIVVGRRWLSQFAEQVSLAPLTIVACLLLILAVLLAVVAFNSLGVARSNPVDHLRSE